MHLLLIEDNLDLSANVGEFLESRGNTVDYARDGNQGLQLAGSEGYDAVILDLGLPGVDGLTLCRRLRDSARRDIPIVMLSGNMDRATLVAARDAGVNEFVAKPVVVANLHARLEACLRRPRPFITSEGYTGPCRRRNVTPFPFNERRARKTAYI